MAEYIDKNATVGILEAVSRNADCECIKKRLEKAAKRVSTIPAADVIPVVHGRWNVVEGRMVDNAICSKCSRRFQKYYEAYRFCPNCGAKMDGGETDDGK